MTGTGCGDISPEVVRDAFFAATTTALSELVQCEAMVEDVPCEAGGDVDGPRIAAVMRLGRATPGRLTLTVPVAVAEQLAGRYLPAGTALNDDILDDVVGEFANVIGGQAKTMLKHTPFHFLMSPPSVSRACEVSIVDGRPENDGHSNGDSSESAVVARVSFRIEVEFGPLYLVVRLPWCSEVDGSSSSGHALPR